MSQSKTATFDPFPPDLDIHTIVDQTPNFQLARRITCDAVDAESKEDFERLVLLWVVVCGQPLVIEGFQDRLDPKLFSEKWLRGQYFQKVEYVRDLGKGVSAPFTIGHYLGQLPALVEKINIFNYANRDRQRLYMKDIDCPPEWHQSLEKLIPPNLFYFNDSPKIYDGPGSGLSNLSESYKTKDGTPIARAGDLMSCLPPDMRAENLMCYIGHEGTYTPAHQEMCASLGHNLMVEASNGKPEHGKPTVPGSSIWLMTETRERRVVSEYWSTMLGHDIDLENHFAQLKAWRCAPFKTHVVEQKPGDLILVPPMAAHQVWNRGTRTMKVAWNRTTVSTLKMALSEALPHARMVCRDEQYKNKAIVYHSLERYADLLKQAPKTDNVEIKKLWGDFEDLYFLFTDILISEDFSSRQKIECIEYHGNVTCSYCRCNIFNRFLTCPSCKEDDNDYDICMDCYVLGRSCQCISKLRWVEQIPWSTLRKQHETWRRQLLSIEPVDSPRLNKFLPLTVVRSQNPRKTVAEICKEQMTRRPWVDCKKPTPEKEQSASPDSAIGDAESPARKRRKTGANSKDERCHMCRNREPNWKLAKCSQCPLRYCYAILFRAFDIFPQEQMEKAHWLCPRCQKICNCGPCQKDPTMRPHEPDNILLGHDTRKIADPRSVDSLVDLRLSNLKWLPSLEEDIARRLQRRQQEAEEKQTNMIMEHAILVREKESPRVDLTASIDYGRIPVDPTLQLDNSIINQPDQELVY
ncbi:hypothetical protein N7495_000647 [Penicillium taxi]|uniref:uncharacterized protein n=1 Tax=Penicillium taxi TaxID=168475 RepID=UPI002545568B|nr:uncharacterized protein N7495_000647 [Penicillium taxi]KAJ5907965.1 hypothetical protein N7495_000647 [Penicillium taxi]